MVFVDKSKRVSVFEPNLQSVAEAENGEITWILNS